MESASVLRSFDYSVGTISQGRSVLERPGTIHVQNASWRTSSKSHIQGLTFGGKLVSSPKKWEGTLVSCVKTSETAVTSKSDGSSDGRPQGSLERNSLRNVTFPNGFEALILEVCDETEVAELKLKIGDFEMHMKRNIGVTKAPMAVISPTTPPAIPTKPMIEAAPAAPLSSPPKPSPEKISPFTNVSLEKSAKLAALEASGASGYVIVSSPTVGSFRRGRTLKGKKQPPICKEGDIIKEGQVIGFLDQFGTELPVKSDVAGEVLKLLFNDGEAVGYGDPLIAVLPSFHGIE
uniref:Lipoyl-binding domain-containing protein n=1 Tax=Davidia involucrata TaxID=16924 RepID=A0A5B6ZXC2_DAVIN